MCAPSQALRKLADGDVARLRSGQYKGGDACAWAPGGQLAASDPRARALVAVDVTLVRALRSSDVATAAADHHHHHQPQRLGDPAPPPHDEASLSVFLALVHAVTMGGGDATGRACGAGRAGAGAGGVGSAGAGAPAASSEARTADRCAAWLALAAGRGGLPAAGAVDGSTCAASVPGSATFCSAYARASFEPSTARVRPRHSSCRKFPCFEASDPRLERGECSSYPLPITVHPSAVPVPGRADPAANLRPLVGPRRRRSSSS